MKIKKRIQEIENNNQSKNPTKVCFQHPGETLNDVKHRLEASDTSQERLLIVRWLN